MTGTLTFNLPEDQAEFELACKAMAMHSVLCDLDRMLRNHIRREENPDWDTATVEKIRAFLADSMEEERIPLIF